MIQDTASYCMKLIKVLWTDKSSIWLPIKINPVKLLTHSSHIILKEADAVKNLRCWANHQYNTSLICRIKCQWFKAYDLPSTAQEFDHLRKFLTPIKLATSSRTSPSNYWLEQPKSVHSAVNKSRGSTKKQKSNDLLTWIRPTKSITDRSVSKAWPLNPSQPICSEARKYKY
jgi:hypothetical protein